MNLSKDFTLEELTFSQTAERKQLNNTPPPDLIPNLTRLAALLQQIQDRLGKPLIISSAYRSGPVNAAVGGSKTSAHVQGLAADINVRGMTPKALAKAISEMKLPIDQVILEYDRWVHVGLSKDKPRGELLTIRQGTGYMTGLA